MENQRTMEEVLKLQREHYLNEGPPSYELRIDRLDRVKDMVIQNIASAAATIIDKVGVRSLTKEQIAEGTKIFKEKGAKAKGAINPNDIKNDKIIFYFILYYFLKVKIVTHIFTPKL